MKKKILLGLLVLIVVFFGYVGTRPSDYVISREIFIAAPAETVFPWINNSRKMNEWMPWAEMDPAMKMSYSGPEEGVGAMSEWHSEGQMGVGSATMTESLPPVSVKTALQYEKPFKMTQMAEMSITSTAGGSTLKWSVQGKNNFMGRLMCVFMNMDKMVGGQFEKGLSKLKLLLENN